MTGVDAETKDEMTGEAETEKEMKSIWGKGMIKSSERSNID